MVELMACLMVVMLVVMVVKMVAKMVAMKVEMMVHNNHLLRFSLSKHHLFQFLLYMLKFHLQLDKVYKMIVQLRLDIDPVNNECMIQQQLSLLRSMMFQEGKVI